MVEIIIKKILYLTNPCLYFISTLQYVSFLKSVVIKPGLSVIFHPALKIVFSRVHFLVFLHL